MPDIFDEVEEDLRAERARRLMRRFGGPALGAVLLLVAGVAGWQGWLWWENRQATAAAAAYMDIHREAEREGADLAALGERFAELGRSAPAGYQALARLRAAALKAETGDREAALALWDQVASDGGADPLYRDLAALLWTMHGLETEDPARLAARVEPLTRPGSPWRASAQEASALIALRQGQTEEARRTLAALAEDPTAPQGVRERAGRLVAGIGG